MKSVKIFSGLCPHEISEMSISYCQENIGKFSANAKSKTDFLKEYIVEKEVHKILLINEIQ